MSAAAQILLTFAYALAATIAIELPLSFAFFHPPRFFARSTVPVVVLMNIVTNPALNLILSLLVGAFGRSVYVPAVAVGEIAVVAAEAMILAAALGLSRRRALAVSAVLNGASFALGLVLGAII